MKEPADREEVGELYSGIPVCQDSSDYFNQHEDKADDEGENKLPLNLRHMS